MADEDPIIKAKTVSLSDLGIHYLCGGVDDSSCKEAIEWIIEENARGRVEKLTLMLTSGGGTVYTSFALIDTMLGSSIQVDTIGLGTIASAALTIFMHGAHRVLTPNTHIMSHHYAGGEIGTHHDLIAARKETDWLGQKIEQMYVKRSNLKVTDVRKLLLGPTDSFITAKEALKYGLADEVRAMGVNKVKV